jgi:4-diphosphocytidyl-2-C-methyl-D-erythritol kinase
MSVRVFAPAKINLTLQVARPRADGMHPLQSVVMFADIGDVIEAAPGEGLSLRVSGEFASDLGESEDNLVLRAARALAADAGLANPGAALTLVKDLPVASGVGGGSADAAATLRALNDLWALTFDAARLHAIARTLGADVPVCLGGRTAYMTGAGETWCEVRAPSFAAVLVNPLQPLATPDVYRQFDAMTLGANFSEQAAPDWPDLEAALAFIAATGNDLEAPARALLPEIGAISTNLRADPRVRYAALSGSGATVFALTARDADALAEELQRAHPHWWVAETVLGA